MQFLQRQYSHGRASFSQKLSFGPAPPRCHSAMIRTTSVVLDGHIGMYCAFFFGIAIAFLTALAGTPYGARTPSGRWPKISG